MKRILVVLLFVAFASQIFAVTGEVYTRLLSAANQGQAGSIYYDAEGWTQYKETPLGDLRVGRRGTGVVLNFDGFSLDYKLRQPIVGSWGFSDILGVYTATANAKSDLNANNNVLGRKAMSPGYFEFGGIKAGPIDLGLGIAWWTFNETQKNLSTNGNGTTNSQNNSTVFYNNFAAAATYNLQLGSLRLHADPWNKLNFTYFMGSADGVKGIGLGTTNKGTVSGYGAVIPLSIDMSMEQLSVNVEFTAHLNGKNVLTQTATTTNDNASSGGFIGAVLKLNYIINENFGVFADVGYEMDYGRTFNVTKVSSTVTTTNADETVSGGQVPIFGGLTFTPASALTFNLGAGYALALDWKTVTISGGTTNTVYNDSRFQAEWDDYQMHGYHKPLVSFGADTKFASDWSAGLIFKIMLDTTMGAGDTGNTYGANPNKDNQTKVISSGGYSSVNLVNILNFNNIYDFDGLGGGSCYLGYSKENFSTKLWVAGGGTLLGLFGAIDVGIKF